MARDGAVSVEELLARREPGRSLEAPFYTSREVFDLDMKLIFHRHWIFVAVEAEIPEAGDYVTVEIGTTSVIVVRDDDMNVAAFHNVCRHRGARMLTEPSGVVGKIVCPYHQWTYELDGSLIHAEHMGAGFDRTCHSLKRVNVRSLAGLLYICLADEPPADFDALAEAMTPYLAPHRLAETKVAASIDLIEEGNWKLTMENNRECYHCATNHPELTVSLFEYGFGFAPDDADTDRAAAMEAYERICAEFETRWTREGVPFAEIDRLHGCATGFRTQRLAIDRAGESQTMDTRSACKRLLGSLSEPRLGGLSFWTQPNAWHHLMADHAVTFSAIPLSPDRTLVRTRWLVHRDAVEGVDYDVDNLTEVWRNTNEQDAALVAIGQKGVSSPAYVPGPYSPYTEGLVEKFCAWYVERLSSALSSTSAETAPRAL
ncbi:aromatic ring-hydroxylating oxygenase subunit alpha [Salinarimonas ramus]|uniref:(Fe-S)-binding protein n=1 Tax=Salinarimonas ramus TaxID=690164 RepID=A0A917QHK2_9HYPH|nr:aromatic ring-hydroxylating dioxygenase subunit alpha [Salinarimonas ramus]GGK50637.1 (Fe-S)-binding protein [Salinarimonas ramus]